MSEFLPADTPWWLVALLVFLGVIVPASGTEKAATLPGLLGAFGRWWQGRRARRRDEAIAEAQAAAHLTASEEVADKEIRRLLEAYDRLAENCRETAARVDELEDRFTASERKFYVLLGHHRVVVDSHRKHAPGVPVPPTPEELAPYL